jgi:hypothetical protein
VRTHYKEHLKLNKNLVISIVVAIIVSATAAQMMKEQEDYANSTYTLLVAYAVFYSTFTTLFYIDNRKKYRLEDGRLNRVQLKKDLVKIITSMGSGEIVYFAMRWYLHYYLLTLGHEPFIASIIAHIVSTVGYLIVVNLGIKLTRLYKHDS